MMQEVSADEMRLWPVYLAMENEEREGDDGELRPPSDWLQSFEATI